MMPAQCRGGFLLQNSSSFCLRFVLCYSSSFEGLVKHKH